MLNVSSLSFNGTNQYGKLSAAASIRNLSTFTFAAWFKVGENATDASKHHAYVERQGTGTRIRFRFTPVRGKLQFGFSPKDGVSDTSYTYSTTWDDRWHHAAFSVRMGGQSPTYDITLDGVRVADGTLVVPDEVTAVSDTASKGIYIGNHSRLNSGESFPSSTAWHGLLDDIIIFNQGMGQGEITTYFSSDDHWEVTTTDPEDTTIMAYWQFNQNSGSQVTDVSRSPVRTGTLYQSGSPTSNIWTIDRPFLGDGLTDETPPSAPVANPHSNVTEDGFDASWATSSDNVWVQFYELQVSQFANFSTYNAYDTGRNRSMSVRGLLPATNYYWRVRAFDAELNASSYSSVRSLTTESLGDTSPPEPPTNLTASFVTHSSFRLNFTSSISNDVVGYKVDVSPSVNFESFLLNYRNRDIGNTTQLDIFGSQPLTSYYVRVRSYDAFDNESNDSDVLRVNTPRQPDITPPLVATLHEPIGISSRSATLQWDEGVDDIGVSGYYVDISTEENFASYIVAAGIYWNTIDVGNVTSYHVEGLEPETTYYYRVRAYDEAGNIASHVEEPMSFLTEAPSAYEGDVLETTHLVETWQNDPTVEPDIIEVNGTTDAELQFNLDGVVGSLESVSLNFIPREHAGFPTTFGDIQVRATAGELGDIQSGSTLTLNITQLDEVVEMDITSLFVSGPQIYTVEISSGGFVGYIDSGISVNGFNDDEPTAPSLFVQSNPMSSTRVLPFDIDIIDQERINDCVNPSFEETDDPWGPIGTTVTGRVDVHASDGAFSFAIAGDRTNSGARHTNDVTKMPETSAGRTHTVSLDIRGTSGQRTYELQIEGWSITPLTSTGILETKAIDIAIGWNRHYITFTTPDNGTEFYRPQILYKGTQAPFGIVIDNLLYEETDQERAPFTGNSAHCEWVGVANASKSRMQVPTLQVESPYLGDENENNEATFYFKHEDDQYWIPVDTNPTVDRETHMYRTILSPTIPNYNLMINPSFEADGVWGGGDYDSTRAWHGARSYRFDDIMTYSERFICEPSAFYTAQARIRNEAGVTTQLGISFYDESMTFMHSVLSNGVYSSTDEWTHETYTFETPSTAKFIAMGARSLNGWSNIDTMQVNKGDSPFPYRDGATQDGMWHGIPDMSPTAVRLSHATPYHILAVYDDPEGFFDDSIAVQYSHSETYATPPAPDNVFTAEMLELEPKDNHIDVILHYHGDDNENARVRFEFKRTDLATWSEFRPTYDRPRKRILGSIPNLKFGTHYTVRAIIEDEDGVYGAQSNIITNTTTTSYLYTSSDVDPHISFGGFILMGRDDDKIGVTSHDAFGFPTRRVNIEDLPRLDGAVELQSLWGRKSINMRGFISGDSRADLDDVRTALLNGLAPRQQRLVIDTLSHKGRFYNATVESLDIIEAADENIRHLSWEARFLCADPFAYDISETVIPTFIAPNNSTISLVNEGDVTTSPQFVITANSFVSISFVLSNDTTGERIAPKATIIYGDRFIIDTEQRSLTKNGIEIDYAGTFPRLNVGGNLMTFTISAPFGTPNLSVDVRWRHKYL